MRYLVEYFKQKVKKYLPSNKNSIFLLGQSSIISSRILSKDFKNLWDAEVKVYSQWGEDGILDYIFGKLEVIKPKIIEIGAGNFSECNSRFAAENLNASVVAIDGRSDLIENVSKSELNWKTHLLGIQAWVTPGNVNSLISKASTFMSGIDLLSLDLDGNDYWIIESANLSSIKIVLVEYNPLFGGEKALSVPEDESFDRTTKHFSRLYYGASLPAFVMALNKKGFKFIGTNRVGNNAFFISEEFSELIPFRPNPNQNCYYDWRIRESRDEKLNLSLLAGDDRLAAIADLPLVDVSTKQTTSLRKELHL